MHSKLTGDSETLGGRTIFDGLPSPLCVGRYHSLVADPALPDLLERSASADEVVMAVRHRELPAEGVQFHPESVLTEQGRELEAVLAEVTNTPWGERHAYVLEPDRGRPAGGVLRVPAEGEARANLHVGGRGVKTELTRRELDICAAIGPTLKEQGLLFVGIDVIGDYITEINVTSPTGIQEIGRLNNDNLAAKIWDAIEAKVSQRAERRPA